jgi:hypothetical protein
MIIVNKNIKKPSNAAGQIRILVSFLSLLITKCCICPLKRRSLTHDLPSGTESLQWVTNTSTLIYGQHDAVVVDTFATIDQNQQLADW